VPWQPFGTALTAPGKRRASSDTVFGEARTKQSANARCGNRLRKERVLRTEGVCTRQQLCFGCRLLLLSGKKVYSSEGRFDEQLVWMLPQGGRLHASHQGQVDTLNSDKSHQGNTCPCCWFLLQSRNGSPYPELRSGSTAGMILFAVPAGTGCQAGWMPGSLWRAEWRVINTPSWPSNRSIYTY